MAATTQTHRADSDYPSVLPVEPDEPVLDALPADDVKRYPSVVPVRAGLWRAFCDFLETMIWTLEWPFGVVTLIVGLAVLAAVPLLGFLSLGYLLEAGGRIARTDSDRQRLLYARKRNWFVCLFLGGWLALRESLIGVRKAARLGGIVLGVAIMMLPLQLLSSL